MPDRNDQAALQKFFFDEIQKGEELLAAGRMEDDGAVISSRNIHWTLFVYLFL